MKSQSIRVLVVDGYPLMLLGLRRSLDGERGIEVVGDAGEGASALAAARKLAPDVAILDADLPNDDGAQLAQNLRAEHPALLIIALTAHQESFKVRQILAAGASECLLKSQVGPREVVGAIRRASAGGTPVLPSVNDRVADTQGPALLSKREREVLELIAAGFANKEIASELGVAVRTVETFRARIQQKLRIHGTAALTRWAIAHGLVTEQ